MEKKNNIVEDPELAIETAIVQTESYIQKHFKTLIIVVAAIIIVTGGYFGYKGLVQGPKFEKASAAAFIAEQYFQVDSFAVALNGAADFEGFLSIADNYSSTPTGNIANHYAGICYLKMKDYDNALIYLKRYNAVDGIAAAVINAQNIGLTGDILMEKGSTKEAISYYKKAAAIDNDFTSPIYLKKMGLAYEAEGDNKSAIENYELIKNQYPSSMEARDIEKYIGRIEK